MKQQTLRINTDCCRAREAVSTEPRGQSVQGELTLRKNESAPDSLSHGSNSPPHFLSETLTFFGRRHAGVVHMNQAPPILCFTIHLCFPAVGRNGRAVLSEPGDEIPVELGPGGIPVDVDRDVVDVQLSLRKGISHQASVEVLLDLLEAVLMAPWVDEGDLWRVPPDLRCQGCVRFINRLRILPDHASDLVTLSTGVVRLRVYLNPRLCLLAPCAAKNREGMRDEYKGNPLTKCRPTSSGRTHPSSYFLCCSRKAPLRE